jgi:DNA-binding XRE family transcriptional regulator
VADKAIRVIVRLKNNRLVRLREDLGLTVTGAAAAIGVHLHTLGDFENFRHSPLTRDGGDWLPCAIRIAEFHGVSCEFIWPEEVRALRAKAMMLEANAGELVGRQLLPDATCDARDLDRAVGGALARLKGYERRAVVRIAVDEERLGPVGKDFGLSTARIQQIKMGALHKLRRDRLLAEFDPDKS